MNTKLTLRVDEAVVRQAKDHAARRGKSVSQMFGEFVTSLGAPARDRDVPPITRSLAGIMKGRRLTEADHKKRLREKHR